MGNYNVAVIGCGSIGANKPDHIDFPGSENILTHCNSINRHPQTELLAIVDTDDDQLQKAKVKWQPQLTVRSYEEILHTKQPDIVIVATPTENHFEVLSEILRFGIPKLIIAEKPFCQTWNEADEIMLYLKRTNVPVLVDYIRRFSTKYQEIKKQIDSEHYGKALNCRILYTRGFKREGCHAIDLMRYFFGECMGFQNLSFTYNYNYSIYDYDKLDPTIPVYMGFANCPNVIFHPFDGRQYGIFEIDICFKKTRLRFIDNGLYIEQYPINQENEWGHKSLDYSLVNVIRTETQLNTALYNVIDNAVQFLDEKDDLICTAEDAIEVHKILEW